jgi:hypothetical protein
LYRENSDKDDFYQVDLIILIAVGKVWSLKPRTIVYYDLVNVTTLVNGLIEMEGDRSD